LACHVEIEDDNPLFHGKIIAGHSHGSCRSRIVNTLNLRIPVRMSFLFRRPVALVI
jgi:hypothetical protein